MKNVIEKFNQVVIQIATPYSTGTGFYLKGPRLAVTNEHVVRDNKEVVIHNPCFEKQLARVVFTDPKYDLAFLEVPFIDAIPDVQFGLDREMMQGDKIVAVGHPFGLKYTATQGIISNTMHPVGDINYLQHDAALNPGNSGGPLVNLEGEIVGVNTFIIQDGDNIGFSLPVRYLDETIREFRKVDNQVGVRCEACSNLVFEKEVKGSYCPHCGAAIKFPSQVEAFEPVGVAQTIEELLLRLGHHVELSRRGPNVWEIQKGSAKINIGYYEKNGLITGDAFLCLLPKEEIQPLYEFMLRQNYEMEGLTFSVRGQDIILSLLIYDRYLNVDTGLKLFRHLFKKADEFDNILVEKYRAIWKQED